MQYLRLPLRAKIAIELFKNLSVNSEILWNVQSSFGIHGRLVPGYQNPPYPISTDTQIHGYSSSLCKCLVLSTLHICGCRMLTEIIICHLSIHYNNVFKILHTMLTNNSPHISSGTFTYLFCFVWFSYFLNINFTFLWLQGDS